MATIMWYLMVAWRVYIQTKSLEVKRLDIPWAVHISVWGMSLIVTAIPLSLHTITEDALDTGTCMLMGRHSSLLFGVPLCLFIIAALLLLGHTLRLVLCPKTTLPRLNGGIDERKASLGNPVAPVVNLIPTRSESGLPLENQQERAIARLKNVSFYLVVFVMFWGSLLVVRIWRLVRSDNTPFALEAVMALSLSLQGFVNSVLWMSDGSLRPWICSCLCCASPAYITRNLSFGSVDETGRVSFMYGRRASSLPYDYDRFATNEMEASFLERVLGQRNDGDDSEPLAVGMTPPNEIVNQLPILKEADNASGVYFIGSSERKAIT
mmetsp:Transcript_25784/g.41436  ORF Transcript_25784/g.41436 Transcript_25784/m.41436 type:complete len:323 (-) Transcript_25784:279-1247(-)